MSRDEPIDAIIEELKAFLLREFLPDEGPDAIDRSTRLIKDHVLDSLSAVKLVTFIETRYHVEILSHEMDEEHLDTLAAIAQLIAAKLRKQE